MRIYDVIRKKRDAKPLTNSEISFFISGFTSGQIPDYQAAALCMAIVLNGMNDRETAALTDCMARSGDLLDLSRYGCLSVDKHSTGGVGDKTSLVVAPIVASLGGKVAKMSGRGLGHTGGTLDKLEAIPGFRTALTNEEFFSVVDKVGMAIIGQTGNLTPADKKLYALRDVTATVDSIPLIVSSVMSKKLAAGSKNIVLDVKCGSGAFMKTPKEAEVLAKSMVKIGKTCGRRVSALITDMDKPLGNAIGNALEVIEAIDVLRGRRKGDLYEVCVCLAGEMTALFKGISPKEALPLVTEAIENRSAYKKMIEWVSAQGGDPAYIENPSLFQKSPVCEELLSPEDGYIYSMNTEMIGDASTLLGAGRQTKEDRIDPGAGIVLNKKTGERVQKGETLCTMYTSDRRRLCDAKKRFLAATTFSSHAPENNPLIYKIIR